MTRVPSFPADQLPDDLQPIGDDPFYTLLAHRPEILRAWHELDVQFFGPSSLVDNRIKEEARRTLAQGVGCAFCASLGTAQKVHPEMREALAVAFAELIANDHSQVDEATFVALREEFSDAEIIELAAWVCFKLGSNIFGAIMKLSPATTDQIDGYAAFVASEPASIS